MACKQIVMRLYRFCDVIYMKNHYVFDIVLNHGTYLKKSPIAMENGSIL